MAPPIRIANLYYLLCYAWDHLEALDRAETDVLEAKRPVDFFARLLAQEVGRRLRRGLDRSYVVHEEETARPRGKLLMAPTLSRGLLERNRVVCTRDELSVDVLHNRLLKGTLRRLAAVPELDRKLRLELRELIERLAVVSDIPVRPGSFRRVQLHRNNADYRFPLRVCELVVGCLLADPTGGGAGFDRFLGDERQMGLLFEAFVRNLLARERPELRARARHVRWPVTRASEDSERLLPVLKTDVSLLTESRRVVIETKFTRKVLVRSRAEARLKLRAGHLRQLLLYLMEPDRPEREPAVGVLLYARTERDLDLELELHGHPLFVRTLDLDRAWNEIHAELIGLVPALLARTELVSQPPT